MSFATRLKELRLKKGQSLQELADDIGVSKAHIWELEAAKSKNPSSELLKKLSDHFQVGIGSLLGEEPGSSDDERMKVLFRQIQGLSPDDMALIETIIKTRLNQGEKKD